MSMSIYIRACKECTLPPCISAVIVYLVYLPVENAPYFSVLVVCYYLSSILTCK